MGILLLDKHLEWDIGNWKSNTSSSVNDPGSDYFEAAQLSDQTMVVTNTYAGNRTYAGGLVSNKRMLPRYNNNLLQYVGMRMRFKWPYHLYYQIARHELDLKVCFKSRPDPNTKIRNVANFSTQWNRDARQFQIDQDPPGWVNTGFVVTDIAPDIWHDIDYRFWYDPAAGIFSVLSISLDGFCYEIPENLRNVPAQLTNWEEIASVQIQNEMFSRGATTIQYSHITLAWSDAPIDVI